MRGLFRFPDVELERDRGANTHGLIARLVGAIKPSLNGVALMFSAGVDSFYSLHQLRRTGLPPAWLLNINAGAHDYDKACWNNRIANVRRVADLIGACSITIDTNFHESFGVEHIRCDVMRNLCAAFALAPAITRFAYSSGGVFEDISHAGASSEIDFIAHAVCQPMTPPGIGIALLGWDAARIEKTREVAADPVCRSHLDVCTDQSYQGTEKPGQPRNCGRCAKCLRTMFTLEHHGHLDLFASQFDVKKFRASRSEWISVLAASTHALDRDVLRLLRA
jgi:hypothetical protein